MSTPNGGNAFRHELELVVTTELTVAETSQTAVEVEGVPAEEWPADPEAQRYDAYLRTLLGAVEALEDGPGPGGPPPQEETR
jgi:hypothetical protein